jgi:hypothetical protein
MRKHESSFLYKYFLLISISILACIPSVKANPVAVPLIPWIYNPFFCIFYITVLFLIGTLVEYFYFKSSISKKNSSPASKNKTLLFTIFKINLVTYPLTQVLAYIFYIFVSFLFWVFIFFIEILVVMIEWQLLKIEFNRIYEGNFVSKNLLKDTSLANLYSFLIGLIGFISLLL